MSPIKKPDMKPPPITTDNILLRASIMMTNNKGDTGLACLYPRKLFEEANIKHCGTIIILVWVPGISNPRTSYGLCSFMSVLWWCLSCLWWDMLRIRCYQHGIPCWLVVTIDFSLVGLCTGNNTVFCSSLLVGHNFGSWGGDS